MNPGSNGAASGLEQVAAEIRAADRFILCTHEHPDGDALGSLAAMQLGLTAMGKDAVSFMAAQELPLPREYRWLPLDRLISEPPADLAERTVVFLDCGNIDRNPADVLKRDEAHILNIDHHHDNTHFGTVDWVDPGSSSTAEMVWLLLGALGVALDRRIADALYVGLVTDTGKFMYENTGPRAHRMAAELLATGIDSQTIYRRLFEDLPQAKLELLARGLGNIERFEGGLVTLTRLSREDYEATGAEEAYSEGVVDHLRAMEGTAVAGLVRDVLTPGKEGKRKVSLRASDDRVDVSMIARALGGGGHRRAAGFTTELEWQEIVELVREQVAAQLQLAA
jgi:bifunctional oligoribonuclease and PAP phosphatase NrnA